MITTEKILLEFDPESKNLLPALRKISAAFGYVSMADAEKVANYFNVELSRVYETASFYDQTKTKKSPRLSIHVCSGTNCTVSGAFGVIREIENYFKIKSGDENNSQVKLEIVSCLGQCGEGPVVVINDKVYHRVNVSDVHRILEEWIS